MPLRTSIDDNNSTLVQYQGEWEYLVGSSRQWESTVHGSLQDGATATFKFRGYQVWIWGTIPPGTGSNAIDVSIDGGTPTSTTRTSNGSAVYNEPYFESPILRDTYHTIVVTNRGTDAKGNTEFLLDKFEFEGSDNVPVFTTTGTFTATGASPTSTPTASGSTTPGPTNTNPSGGSKTPWGAIIGAIVAVFLLLIIFLLFLLWRRRKRDSRKVEVSSEGEKPAPETARHPVLAPIPFPLPQGGTNTESSSSPLSAGYRHSEATNAQPSTVSNPVSEKASLQRNLHLASISSPSTEAPSHTMSSVFASSTSLRTAPSSQLVPPTTAPPTSSLTDPEASMYAPNSTPLRASVYDNPPPSYS